MTAVTLAVLVNGFGCHPIGGGGHASSATLKPAAAKATQFGGFGSSGKSFSSFGDT
jgi:hypothetical protein